MTTQPNGNFHGIRFSFIHWAQLFVYIVAIRNNSIIWYKSHSIHSFVLCCFLLYFILFLCSLPSSPYSSDPIAMVVVLFPVWNAFHQLVAFYNFIHLNGNIYPRTFVFCHPKRNIQLIAQLNIPIKCHNKTMYVCTK